MKESITAIEGILHRSFAANECALLPKQILGAAKGGRACGGNSAHWMYERSISVTNKFRLPSKGFAKYCSGPPELQSLSIGNSPLQRSSPVRVSVGAKRRQ